MAFFNFNPPVIAHRGASGYAPENTMLSFRKAAQLGIKWVEFDVLQSADGETIIFHDEILERTTNGQGEPQLKTFAELRHLDAGSWFDATCVGERIPSLREALAFFADAKMSLNIEIKPPSGQDEAVVRQTLLDVEPYLSSMTILFSSFSLASLQCLKKLAPHSALGFLIHEWYTDWERDCQDLNCVSVHVYDEILNAKMTEKIKNMGKQVLCYTVNNPDRALELYSWGVDAVFSDVPDQIVAAL